MLFAEKGLAIVLFGTVGFTIAEGYAELVTDLFQTVSLALSAFNM